MSKVCSICQKGPSTGNTRSHSNRATRRRFLPNLTSKTIYCEDSGLAQRMKLCTRCIRSIAKSGSGYIQKMLSKRCA